MAPVNAVEFLCCSRKAETTVRLGNSSASPLLSRLSVPCRVVENDTLAPRGLEESEDTQNDLKVVQPRKFSLLSTKEGLLMKERKFSVSDSFEGPSPPLGPRQRFNSLGSPSTLASENGGVECCLPSPLQPPRLSWEDIVVGRELGRGSFGVVKRAFVSSSGEQVAVKLITIDPGDAMTKKQVRSLKAELHVLRAFGGHERLVKLRGYGEIEEGGQGGTSVFIITELMPGGSLRSALKDYGPMNEECTSKGFSQIVEGLYFLHSKCILHRDLKSDNVLLDLYGNFKLADFGSSRLQEKTVDGQEILISSLHGSVPWMAPEVVNPISGYDAKADVWSLGCLLIEMITAKRPWGECDNVMAVFYKICSTSELPEIPKHVSPVCRDVICRCLERERHLRIDSGALLQHAFCAGRVVHPSHPSPLNVL